MSATATAEKPKAASGGDILWGVDRDGHEVHIPVLGVTGPYQSGKTLFMLTIAPGGRRTRFWDVELGAKGYLGLEPDYVNVREEISRCFPRGHRPIDLFRWWLEDAMKCEPGKYLVGAIDPITDIEAGMVDWVASKHREYGFATEDKFRAMGGAFWGQVKAEWKTILADLSTRFETLAFSAHLRKEVVGGKVTSRDKAGGKSTLAELASLYLWLDRSPDQEGKVPARPRCKMKLKDRVDYTSVDPETYEPIILPYLPPAFSDCTPKRIREYIEKPANYDRLKKDERVRLEQLSEDERLAMRERIAELEAEKETSVLARLNRQAELAALAARASAARPAAPDRSQEERVADQEADQVEERPAAAGERPAEPPRRSPGGDVSRNAHRDYRAATTEQVARLVELKGRLGMTLERFEQGIARHTPDGSNNPLDLPYEKAEELIRGLGEVAARQGK